MKSAAALLLLMGVLRHYLWEVVRPEWMVHAWNIAGSAVIVTFLWALAYRWRATVLIAIWWTFEEAQVVLCSTWLMFNPQPPKSGTGECSALLGVDLGTLGLLLVSLILAYHLVPVRTDSFRKKEKKP